MTTPEPKTELKPCPFCNGEPFVHEIKAHKHSLAHFMPDFPGAWYVECCYAATSHKDRNEAIRLWNTRAPVEASHESGVDAPIKGIVYMGATSSRHFYIGKDSQGFHVFETPDWQDQPYSGYKENWKDELTGIVAPSEEKPADWCDCYGCTTQRRPCVNDKSAPKAGQVDVAEIKRELMEKFVPCFEDTNAVLRDRHNTDGYIQHTHEIIDHLHAQGYLNKPIAGLREKVEGLRVGARPTWENGDPQWWDECADGYNQAIDAVIELIDRGA